MHLSLPSGPLPHKVVDRCERWAGRMLRTSWGLGGRDKIWGMQMISVKCVPWVKQVSALPQVDGCDPSSHQNPQMPQAAQPREDDNECE